MAGPAAGTGTGTGSGLERARQARWWQTRAQIKTINRASAFIEDVGFALLFPRPGVALPSLWDVVRDDPQGDGWGPDLARMWAWKDELPNRRLAWYRRFLMGQPSLLALGLLADLYPDQGVGIGRGVGLGVGSGGGSVSASVPGSGVGSVGPVAGPGPSAGRERKPATISRPSPERPRLVLWEPEPRGSRWQKSTSTRPEHHPGST